MGLLDYFRRLLSGDTFDRASDGPTFRCLRCGAEYDRQYDSCRECGVAFVVEVRED